MKSNSSIIFLLLLAAGLRAQDVHFSQFGNSPLTLNPALTGMFVGDLRATANFKDQWSSVSKAYKTLAVACDMQLLANKWKKGFLGAGISVFNDKSGDGKLNHTQVNLSVSSSRKLNDKNILTAGIMGGWARKSIDYSALTWGSQYDLVNGAYNPGLSSNENFSAEKISFPDFSAGVDWNYGKIEARGRKGYFLTNAGIAWFHVNKPNQSFYSASDRLYSKLTGHALAVIKIENKNISFIPGILYMRQGPSQEIMAGSLFRYALNQDSEYTGYVHGSAISFGGYYRFADAAVLMGQFEFSDYMIGVSYDINVSGLSIASSGLGGFEITLRYTTGKIFQNMTNSRF